MTSLDPSAIRLYRYGEDLPPEYWHELSRRDSGEVCRRTLVAPHGPTGFQISFLGRDYLCDPVQRRIRLAGAPEERLGFQEYLILLVYLLQARDLPLSGEWVNEKELRGGALFFRGPHALFREPLEKRFARDPGGLLRAGLAAGGVASGRGDASFRLQALPRIPLEYIFYGEDEEFPAQLTMVFDRTVERHLPLDVIWALVNVAGQRVLRTGEQKEE